MPILAHRPGPGYAQAVPVRRAARTTITSRQNPLVARFREAGRGGAGGLLLLDGVHLIVEALDAGLALDALAVTDDALEDPAIARLVARVPEAVTVSPEVLDAMSPVRTASGVVALAGRPVTSPESCVAADDPLTVIAVDVQDPGNLGALVRSAEAAGATGVLTTAGGADPFGWKALRGAMGSAFRLPLARVDDAGAALSLARRHGLRVVAAVARGGAPMSNVGLRGPVALVLGGEGPGLDAAVAAAADERITIPMAAPVESLNVAVAAALLVYEARRQRTGGSTLS